MRDDRGPFLALGVSLFAAANLFRTDRDRLERILRWLAQHGVDYIRALACVGAPPFWVGREVDPKQPGWQADIVGTTQLAFACGVRVQWTLFGDAQVMVPSLAERQRVVDAVAAVCVANPEAVIAVELWNEYWQNGGEDLNQMRSLAQRFRNQCPDLALALSCPQGADGAAQEADSKRLNDGSVATFTTDHYDRQMTEDGWRPVRQPWQRLGYDGVPPGAANNEPIGIGLPGGSNPTDDDPHRQVTGAAISWLTRHWGHVLHDRAAGTRIDRDWAAVSNIDQILSGIATLKRLLPADLPNWFPQQDGDPDGPFENVPNWVDPGQSTGVVRQYSTLDGGGRFITIPFGIRSHVDERARRALRADVYDVLTGDALFHVEPSGGQAFRLTDAQPVYLLLGEDR